MRLAITVLILLIGLCDFAIGQVFPDSLKETFIAQLRTNDTLTIYISRESCFYFGFEKFQLTKQNDLYNLKCFHPISEELPISKTQCRSIYIDTLNFKALKTYTLTDTNIIAFAQIEFLGQKCGLKPRGSGNSIGIYKIKFKEETKTFSNICHPIKELEEIAIPEKYYEDREEQ